MSAARSIILLALASGCTVSVPDLVDEGFFACALAADCGPGQACAEGNVFSRDFCRPACTLDDPSSCPDGVCTAAGACLPSCAIDPDGTSDGCASDEFACVRIDAIHGEGVCWPAEPCSRTQDCMRTPGRICLNDALGLPAESSSLDFRNLYCTASADEAGRCPSGYLSYPFTNDAGVLEYACYPPCELDGDGPWCPPATTCFAAFGQLAGTPDTPPCLPGVWGLPCEDDTHCLVGRCLPVGRGHRACTETCLDAEEFGGCRALEGLGAALGVLTRMSCESVGEVETCVPRFDLLSICSDQLQCLGLGTICVPVDVGFERQANLCLRGCASAEDCAEATSGVADDYRCLVSGTSGICMRRRPYGGRCAEDLDCAEGRCCDVDPDYRACTPESRCAG